MKNLKFKKIFYGLTLLIATSCSRTQFKDASQVVPGSNKSNSPAVPVKPNLFVFEKELSFKSLTESFLQEPSQDNQIEITFRAKDSEGFNLGNIKKEDLLVDENLKPVGNFILSLDQQNIGKKVDLVIVLDVTNSMEETILLVKSKVTGFVKQLEAKKWNSALCLVTFRDDTAQTCSRIVEDDPLTARNENLDFFLAELAKAKTIPSGDWDENQLKGLIDASEKTPWRDNAQRVQILMTNSTFSYAPQNRGDAGDKAPTYEETLSVLGKKQINLFTVAPKAPGYDKAFTASLPALHEMTGGSYFNFQKMINGSVPLDQIFNSIIDRLATDYKLTYSSEANSLDAELPLSQRSIRVQLKNTSQGQITVIGQKADWPTGRPELRKKWKLASQASPSGQRKVFVNGQLLGPADYSIDNAEIILKKAPRSKSIIQIVYDPLDLNQALPQFSLAFNSNADLTRARWLINDQFVDAGKLNIKFEPETNLWKIDFSKLSDGDIFFLEIYKNRKLKIRVTADSSIEESTR